jgi:PIN domain nuclease of toxin-antitoxin system
MILLDTCSLYWIASDPSKLSANAVNALRANPAVLYVSAISAFEVVLNHRKRRVVLPTEPRTWFAGVLGRYNINCLSITWEIAAASASLPPIHSDPADRIIVATAIAHSLPILTPDHLIAAYPGVGVVW